MDLKQLFAKRELIPAVVQDVNTNEVLMLAYMNEESLNITLETGKVCFFSRSRNELWVKGETHGHYQYVREIMADCEMNSLLIKAEQIGVPCHTGARTCFFNRVFGEK